MTYGLTQPGTGCFIAAYPFGNGGRQSVLTQPQRNALFRFRMKDSKYTQD